MTTVRLAAGGVCAVKGFDLDMSEDCKVCITEGLLLLKHRGYAVGRVRFFEEEGLRISVEGEGEGEEEGSPEDEISLALLSALLGEIETTERGGKLSSITFTMGSEK